MSKFDKLFDCEDNYLVFDALYFAGKLENENKIMAFYQTPEKSKRKFYERILNVVDRYITIMDAHLEFSIRCLNSGIFDDKIHECPIPSFWTFLRESLINEIGTPVGKQFLIDEKEFIAKYGKEVE